MYLKKLRPMLLMKRHTFSILCKVLAIDVYLFAKISIQSFLAKICGTRKFPATLRAIGTKSVSLHAIKNTSFFTCRVGASSCGFLAHCISMRTHNKSFFLTPELQRSPDIPSIRLLVDLDLMIIASRIITYSRNMHSSALQINLVALETIQ